MVDADIYNMSDVFISYSRKDSEFVHRLFDDIKATGKEVWADFEDIPKAADWWREIQAGIDAADAFVFIISPDSVNSDICRQEIDHALASNKRLLPVLYREVIAEEDKPKVHSAISSHNWIFFREQDDYNQAFQTLLESLETDLDHNRTLTRLLVRAKEWQDNNQGKGYLLQGDDLDNAEDWLAHSMNKRPSPTNIHAEYINASRAAAMNRQRQLFILSFGGMVVALLLAVFSVYQMFDAQKARDAAEVAREQAEIAQGQAEESAQEARAIALAASANEALANNNPDLALVLAREAINIETNIETITTSLADAAFAPGTIERIEVDDVLSTVVYAPDASMFIAGFLSGNICLYNGEDYQQIACLMTDDASAHADSVRWIHLSHDGTRLLSSSDDDRLILWDVEHDSPNYGMIVNEIVVPNLRASALASDGTFAIAGTDDGIFGIWDLSSDDLETVSYQHGAAINVIALNAENESVLAGTANGVLLQYDIADFNLVNIYVNPNNLSPINSVAFNPDSTIAVAGDLSASLTSWDLETESILRTYQGHDENVTAIAFSDDGRTMFTASWDNSIREWDVSSGRIVQSFFGHNGGINALSVTSDNLYMVSGGFDSTIRVWLVHPIIFEDQFVTNNESIYSADWNNTHIVTGNENGEIFIYDRQGNLLHNVVDENGQSGAFFTDIRKDGNNFVVVYGNCNLTLFNMRGDILWTTLVAEASSCRQVGFHPTMDEILVLSESMLYRVDGRSGDILGTIPNTGDDRIDYRSFAFTPDGNQLLLGSNARSENLHLIDVATGEIIRSYQGHTDGVLNIDLSDDGTKIVSGSFDNDVRVWDFATGELLALLEGHSDRIIDVDFNLQGNSVISASNDTTVRLWDIATGVTRYTYGLHTDRVVSAIFSDDGTRMLTASHDSTLIVWRFPQRLDELQQWVSQNRYLRELTCGERNIYLSENNECQ
ncbi:MAG: TIR domain-containing protein [Phototrophicaceae bacterium]